MIMLECPQEDGQTDGKTGRQAETIEQNKIRSQGPNEIMPLARSI